MSDLLNSASLVMIPSGYKEDTVYSVVPSDGSGDLTLTRASNGTRVNSAGLVEVVAWNLLQYSEQFTNGVWSPRNGTFTDNFAVAPNGTTTAAKWQATDSDPYIYQAFTGVNVDYTATCWIKATGTAIGKNCSIRISGDLAVTTMTGEWQQLTITANINGSENVGVEAPESATSGEIVYIWGFQLNIGSTAKPYFPTTDRLNVPRLTYQNGGGGCPSLLLEKQSTNLALYSEQFDNASWNATNTTISANATISPDGTQNADNSVTVSSNGTLGRSFSIPANSATYTQSVYVKWVSGYESFMIRTALIGGTSVSGFTIINCKTGVVISSDTTNKIESVGNGWFRLSHQLANNGTNTTYIYQIYNTLDTAQTQTISLWGAQVEASSYPTSYIPTTSSSATRVADACFKTGISSLIGQSEGTMFVQMSAQDSPANNWFQILDGSANNWVFIGLDGSKFRGYVRFGSSTVFDNLTFSLTNGVPAKIALAYKSGDIALYINGSQIAVSSSTFTPSATLSQVIFGDLTNPPQDSAKYSQAVLFKTRLTNTQLAQLTA